MKDRRGEVIYVGKAANLKLRVASYFRGGRDESRLITRRIGEVHDIDCIVTRSEKEAFLLENNFIKQFRPKYNVLFRDDKSFVSIKIPQEEPYPRPIITRRTGDKNARYFGPYSNSRAARRTLDVLQEIFPLRKCTLRQCRTVDRPCLYGQMGKCLSPCCNEVSEQHYAELIDELSLFLDGQCDELLERMRAEMRGAAGQLDFERAAALRDRIRAVEETVEQQLASSTSERVDRDVFGYYPTDRNVWVAVLFIRDGGMRDAATYNFPAQLDAAEAILRSFVKQFYFANRYMPEEILLPVDAGDLDLPADWLCEKRGGKVKVLRPQRGRKRRLVELASQNALQAQKVKTGDREKRLLEMQSLQDSLVLDKAPLNIECFDISNLSGREATGSMVVFRNGVPDKGSYRRYRIRDIGGRDDEAMMREVIGRRYRHVREKTGKEFLQKMPELIVVDGGKGQLRAACNALEELQLRQGDIIALAKARTEGGRRVKRERVFVPGKDAAVELEENSHGFRLLTRIRDEAHRFAIQYHRKLRRKASIKSPLTEIPGVGEKMAARLLERFKSLGRVREAGTEELCEVKGISAHRAGLIKKHIEEHWS